MTATVAPFTFELPTSLVADRPPEARGIARDHIRLLVGGAQGFEETRFDRLGASLRPGDLLVVNDSETRPAALTATRSDRRVAVHLSAILDDHTWVIEVRRSDQSGPDTQSRPGDTIDLAGGGQAALIEPVGPATRLWRATLELPSSIDRYLARNGQPIQYPYVVEQWPLSTYTTMFAKPDRARFGSAEMPSAGRPFTRRLVADLRHRGIDVVAITLHTGVSSLEAHETPPAERFRVDRSAAAAVNKTKTAGGRVIAVGTSVVRALESVGATSDHVASATGWTDLVLGQERAARIVDGLVTGWHPPEASHLRLLEAVAGGPLVETMYRAALDSDFLWHEFGDAALVFATNR